MTKHTYPQSNKQTHIVLIAILILAAALRFFYLAQIQNNPLPEYVTTSKVFDQYRFIESAKEFLKGNWLGLQVPPRYSLAYSYLIAFLYTFFPQNINTLFIFQVLLGLVAVYVFYRTGSLLFGNKNVGLIAAFIAALYSPFLFQECNMERGAIIAYANLLGFYFLLKAVRKHKLRYFFFSGLAIGVSTVLRGNILFPFIVAYILFMIKKLYKFKMVSILLFSIGVLLITSPLSIRNKIVGNTFLIEPQTIENFWIGNTYDSPGVGFWASSSRLELTKECKENIVKTFKIFIREIKKHPIAYRDLYWRKIRMFFSGYEIPANLSYDQFKENHSALKLSFITFGIICPLALLGIAVVRKKYATMGLLYIFLCVLSISNILFHIQGRYRIPVIPFLIILAAYAIYWCSSMLLKKDLTKLCIAIIAIVLFSLYIKPKSAFINNPVLPIRTIDYSNLATAYFEKANDVKTPYDHRDKLLQKAVTNLSKYIKLDPTNIDIYLRLGYIYYRLGQYEAAKEVFNTILLLDPNNENTRKAIVFLSKK